MPSPILRRDLALASAVRGATFVLALGAGSLGTAQAGEGAPWTLTQDNVSRSCPLTLRFDNAGAAGALSVPPGCRHAMPSIAQARSWSIDSESAIRFAASGDRNLLTLTREADGRWHGRDTGGQSFTLIPPSSTALQAPEPAVGDDAVQTLALAKTPVPVAAADPTLNSSVIQLAASTSQPAGSASTAAAGRYAVMRGDRDTGCMVTLEGGQRGGKDSARARLAPACRDQGITIFDPMSWRMKGSELVLTARKGHSIDLDKDENGVWVKMPKDAKALGLKPI